MKIYAEQIWALNNVKNRAKTDDQTNGLQEFLPGEYRAAFGERNFQSGNFFYMDIPEFVLTWNILAAWGGLTEWGKESGIAGGMTTDQSKNLWSRFGECAIPANHRDNHEINGATVTSYEHLRWGITWASRAFGGWTPSAAISVIWEGITFFPEAERKDIRGWSCGCPCWYSEHQP